MGCRVCFVSKILRYFDVQTPIYISVATAYITPMLLAALLYRGPFQGFGYHECMGAPKLELEQAIYSVFFPRPLLNKGER